MSNTEKGVLIFKEWFEALETLSAKSYKELLSAIYHYQILGEPPPEFKGKSKIIASVIFPYIERRIQQSAHGKRGFEIKNQKAANTPSAIIMAKSGCLSSPSAAPATNPSRLPSSSPAREPSSNRIEENINNIVYHSIAENSVKENADDAPAEETDARAERSELCTVEKEGTEVDVITTPQHPLELFGYGVYKNVFLSTEEYLTVKNTVENADEYIDMFSRKMHDKGYRYPSHAKAIIEWWQRDSKIAKNRDAENEKIAQNTAPQGSFDTDEFFEAAVRRSLGA